MSAVAAAYDESADSWLAGPAQLYARLAEAMVAASPTPLAGARVLDVGAGTGVASRAARAAGATDAVGIDIADGMLRRNGNAFHAVLADAGALPFRAGTFDLVLAACCLGHLPDPGGALREARRVAGATIASAFAPGWTHPAKGAVDDALLTFGFRPPDWYVTLKRDTEPQVDDPDALALLGRAAGFRHVEVRVVEVVTELDTPADLASWRLGMAHLAPFMKSLPSAQQFAARTTAEAALVGAPPLVVPLVLLIAR